MTPEKELEFERKLNALCMSNARIENVLIGDEMGSIGVAQRIVNNEKRIEIIDEKIDLHTRECDKAKNRRAGVLWVVGILWTVLIAVLGFIL